MSASHGCHPSLGARFEEMETNWRPAALPSPVARVIQVDIDAAEIGRSVPAQLGIIGDIRAVLEDLLVRSMRARRRGGEAFGPMRASRNARPSSSARTSRSRRKRRAGNGRSIRCASSALCARGAASCAYGRDRHRLPRPAHGGLIPGVPGASAALADPAVKLLRHGLCRLGFAGGAPGLSRPAGRRLHRRRLVPDEDEAHGWDGDD